MTQTLRVQGGRSFSTLRRMADTLLGDADRRWLTANMMVCLALLVLLAR